MNSQHNIGQSRLPLRQVLAYGGPGLPVAAATLPLFILVPTLYSQLFGLSLFAVGLILIGVRIFDALTDPVIGILSDKIDSRWGLRKPWIAASTPFLMLSLYMILVPPPDPSTSYLLTWSIVLTLSWTCFVLPYTAWGAEISDDYHERTRITSSREGLTLLGTLIIAAFPATLTYYGYASLLDHTEAIALFVIVTLPLTVIVALAATGPTIRKSKRSLSFRESFSLVTRNRPFRILILSYFLNSLANGIPATLFVFFVTHVLKMPDAYGYLLFLYFVSAIVGIPVWFLVSKRLGKRRAWSLAMGIAIAFFVWTPLLSGSGHMPFFVAIVLATGFTLGADLILPPSMQADVIDVDREASKQERAGLFFALWGISTKLALGLASGVSLIGLWYAGFDPQPNQVALMQQPATALVALGLFYGLVPVFFKLLSIYVIKNLPEPQAIS